jgi:CBS domain-containing protein
MTVKELMTKNPATCAPETALQEVAKLMVDRDCGAVPVVDKDGKPIGVVTDRDITCRAVAQGRNPLELVARDCMSEGVVTVSPDTDVDECVDLMEANQIRRAIVVDGSGRCCGIIAQADLAQAGGEQVQELVEAVSRPTDDASSPASH